MLGQPSEDRVGKLGHPFFCEKHRRNCVEEREREREREKHKHNRLTPSPLGPWRGGWSLEEKGGGAAPSNLLVAVPRSKSSARRRGHSTALPPQTSQPAPQRRDPSVGAPAWGGWPPLRPATPPQWKATVPPPPRPDKPMPPNLRSLATPCPDSSPPVSSTTMERPYPEEGASAQPYIDPSRAEPRKSAISPQPTADARRRRRLSERARAQHTRRSQAIPSPRLASAAAHAHGRC